MRLIKIYCISEVSKHVQHNESQKGVCSLNASFSFGIQDVALCLQPCLTERLFNFSPC